MSLARVDRIIDRTLHTAPRGATHWSTRTLAQETGVSNATIARIRKSHKIQPHRERSVKLSRDPEFNEKMRGVVGPYMSPPDKAVVVCIDERSGCRPSTGTRPSSLSARVLPRLGRGTTRGTARWACSPSAARKAGRKNEEVRRLHVEDFC
ncbi:MAG: hypothetical protein JRN16_03755 [Nitrososphaerota archaeon]|nr:hypothetical protein [Nitrososphaerota archaeon]MDG7027508.1 hypothetical protein [Nitrososphaerota archaeon]